MFADRVDVRVEKGEKGRGFESNFGGKKGGLRRPQGKKGNWSHWQANRGKRLVRGCRGGKRLHGQEKKDRFQGPAGGSCQPPALHSGVGAEGVGEKESTKEELFPGGGGEKKNAPWPRRGRRRLTKRLDR